MIISLAMGPGQKFVTWVGSGQFFVAWVRSGQPPLVWVWVWKLSPKIPNFSVLFPLDQKKSHRVGLRSTWVKAGSASYLLRVKSMLSLGWVRAHL